jgi:bifunctional UDP-N-acetylglucosamine pyrophosphorylase/glucosamine-1-phosphate N-acetyltransferase
VEQARQLGTGHAVAQAIPGIPDNSVVLVLYGDVPLVLSQTLRGVVDCARTGNVGLLTVRLADPIGYGRIVRDSAGRVAKVVEEKDASAEERHIAEVNTGIIAAPADRLKAWVTRLENDNAQGEYYLTDIIGMAVAAGHRVETFSVREPSEVLGVNDRAQLASLERIYQRRLAETLMRRGVTLLDPTRLDVRGELVTGRDVVIDVNVIFEGDVRLGDCVYIGPNTVIRNTVIGSGTEVRGSSHIEDAIVGEHVQVGPFARIRPGTQLENGSRIGNFVEVKNSSLGPRSKVSHLSYIGESEIGSDVNVGAGTITCNYDGAHKHLTVIEDGVFIGSNTALVAPVRVGRGSTIGAGSTIVKDVPSDHLALSRASQRIVAGWKRPEKDQK